MLQRLYFPLSPETVRAWRIGPAWALLPLRVPTGWSLPWNTLLARVSPSGAVEFNDSEDLLLAVKLPAPDSLIYDTDPGSRWREIRVDAGWYRDHFKLAMLDPGWDRVRHTYTTADPIAFLHTLERWLAEIAEHGDLRIAPPPV